MESSGEIPRSLGDFGSWRRIGSRFIALQPGGFVAAELRHECLDNQEERRSNNLAYFSVSARTCKSYGQRNRDSYSLAVLSKKPEKQIVTEDQVGNQTP